MLSLSKYILSTVEGDAVAFLSNLRKPPGQGPRCHAARETGELMGAADLTMDGDLCRSPLAIVEKLLGTLVSS